MPRPALAVLLAAALLLTGCAAAVPGSATPPSPSSDAVPADGVVERAEPALHLTTLAHDGGISHLDLATGASETIARIEPADTVVSDGRHLFALREGSVTIVDSGAWTWSHGDHFHYYAGPPRVVGDIEGPGTPTVIAGERSIGIHFDGGEDVLVKTAPLADGEIQELFRRPATAGAGMVVPLAFGAWVTERAGARPGGPVVQLRHVDEDGGPAEAVPCAGAEGSIATVVGVVVACEDGVVLAVDGRPAATERIAYPADGDRVRGFSGREGRPAAAARSDGGAIQVLDTRAREWHPWRTGSRVTALVAVGDDAGHVVAIGGGEIVVHDERSGRVLSRVDAPPVGDGTALFAEQRRTIVADPDGTALVVDHRTGALIQRYDLPAGHTVLTGR